MPGNVCIEIVSGSGQQIGNIVMAANKTNFTNSLISSIGTVGTGYINAKWNERNDVPERTWYSS